MVILAWPTPFLPFSSAGDGALTLSFVYTSVYSTVVPFPSRPCIVLVKVSVMILRLCAQANVGGGSYK